MQISCPQCQRMIPTDALNMQQLVAKCTACHLYTKEHRSRQRNRDSTFEVHLIDRNNQHAKLVTGLPSSEHALYVEQEIERFLGIVDRPVRGEYR